MSRTVGRTATVLLALACSQMLECAKCKCDGDVCTDCPGSTVATAPPDTDGANVVDATLDAQPIGAPPDVTAAGQDGVVDLPIGCAGGCACFNSPDACAAHFCSLATVMESDGASLFECINGPLGFICETEWGGRCLDAGSTCANPAPKYNCDPWPSTGAFCCMDQVDAGDGGDISDAQLGDLDGGASDAEGGACTSLYRPCDAQVCCEGMRCFGNGTCEPIP
jgi:hypothetical protein